jgi:SRSO17 transposase
MVRAVQDLDVWLEPFLAALGHKKRRLWAPLYLRGLLGPSERKSLQPMAASLGLPGHDQLQHFIASPTWDDAPLWRVLAEQADQLVGGPQAALVIDDTALPKKGTLSVGVARQYCGQLGKRANCQALVSLTLAGKEVPVPVGLRLFLPEAWTGDPERCRRAGVPEARLTARTKPEMALEELDRLRALGVRFGEVVADAGYGPSAAFRRGLSERGLSWVVGIACTQTVDTTTVEVTWPRARTGRPRKRGVASKAPVAAEEMLKTAAWQRVTGRTGTKGALSAEFAALRVRVAEGPPQRDGTPLPGDELWLVGERRSGGEHKYYLSNKPADTALSALARQIKARWVCEQGHQQMKEELGLDHFEGRGWHGLHHHAVLVMIAFAFLQHLRLSNQLERGKNDRRRPRPAAPAHAARHPARHPRPDQHRRPCPMSVLSSLADRAQTRVEMPK